jgi:hypothetical protein
LSEQDFYPKTGGHFSEILLRVDGRRLVDRLDLAAFKQVLRDEVGETQDRRREALTLASVISRMRGASA